MVIDWILPFCIVEQQPHHSFITKCLSVYITPCKEIRNPGHFYFWNLESWAWNPESGIPLRIRIQNPSFTDKESGSTTWNPESKTVLVYPKWGTFVTDKSLGLANRTPVDVKP